MNSKFKIQNSKLTAPTGFTLIELLIVIATIGILAALLMPVFASVSKHAIIQRAQSERDLLETAIESYNKYYGFYPPGNAGVSAQFPLGVLTNQLFYELEGTTTGVSGGNTNYTTLDDADTVLAATVQSAFGVSGFMNYSKGSAEDSKPAKNFIPGLSGAHFATNYLAGSTFISLVTAANSDPSYKPLPGILTLTGGNANPWRYLSPGIHNPQSYDLWIQVFVGGKTNLISNWKTDPEINSPLP
jgi:prepilin-type N-terminal cleavage/methylation domain-containing protein